MATIRHIDILKKIKPTVPYNDWVSQITEYNTPRATMDKLVLDYLVSEG